MTKLNNKVDQNGPYPILTFQIQSEKNEYEPETEAHLTIVFEFNEKYPIEKPIVRIEESENVEDEDDLLEFIEKSVIELELKSFVLILKKKN
jgi:hypothetical protein